MLVKCFIFVLIAKSVLGGPLPLSYTRDIFLANPSVQKFREYVQIDTSKEENIELAVEFWRRQAQEVGLSFTVHRPAGKPICVLTWQGTEPTLPSIMLNSHMDVVPVEEEFWTYSAFSAHIDDYGDIYGRGTQDDKDVAIQYIEAITRLKENNITLLRTLHMTLMPDEEIGGYKGMVEFIKTDEFAALNVGFALDEGIVSSTDVLYVTYQDKRPWQIKITVKGEGGHGSSVVDDTAFGKLQKLIERINEYRDDEKRFMFETDPLDYGAYDSVNINVISGGIIPNVIPRKMSLIVDIRLALSRSVEEMQNIVNTWVSETGNGTEVHYIRRVEESQPTPIDDSRNYWKTTQDVANDMGFKILPIVCPAASDMINLRNIGIPALGFAPKSHTEKRIHGVDEYLNAATFLRGIDIYVELLQKLGNLELLNE